MVRPLQGFFDAYASILTCGYGIVLPKRGLRDGMASTNMQLWYYQYRGYLGTDMQLWCYAASTSGAW
eukprot:2731820-Rhodomonas_salina.2